MLILDIPDIEYWDEQSMQFIQTKSMRVRLEHSLVAIFQWEGITKKAFLSTTERDVEETKLYIRCMMITQKVPDLVFNYIYSNCLHTINEYINDPATATTINDIRQQKPSHQTITAEYMYYWLVTMNIPFDCAKWHLNRMLALVKVIEIENNPKKKMSKKEAMEAHRARNAARRVKSR